jgi:hypothetical protein
MRRYSTFSLKFRELKRGTQLKEGVTSKNGADKNTVRFQGFLDLYKHAYSFRQFLQSKLQKLLTWQIVNPMKTKT